MEKTAPRAGQVHHSTGGGRSVPSGLCVCHWAGSSFGLDHSRCDKRAEINISVTRLVWRQAKCAVGGNTPQGGAGIGWDGNTRGLPRNQATVWWRLLPNFAYERDLASFGGREHQICGQPR